MPEETADKRSGIRDCCLKYLGVAWRATPCWAVTFQVGCTGQCQQGNHGHHSKRMINDWTEAAKLQGLKYESGSLRLKSTHDFWSLPREAVLSTAPNGGGEFWDSRDRCSLERPQSPCHAAQPPAQARSPTAGYLGSGQGPLGNISKDRHSTTSLGNLCNCLTLLVDKVFTVHTALLFYFLSMFLSSFSETKTTNEHEWSK